MEAYLVKVKVSLDKFEYYYVEQIAGEDNAMTDALTRLATIKEAEQLNVVPIEILQ